MHHSILIYSVINSEYTLCYRGAANYSLRFYESLCLGRIPLFINTDCMLPFEDRVHWKDVCLWVEEHNLKYIGDALLQKINSGIGILGTVTDDKPQVVIVVTKDLIKNGIFAGNIAKEVGKTMGGGGFPALSLSSDSSLLLTRTRTYTLSSVWLSLIHICRCRRIERCRSRWSPYH